MGFWIEFPNRDLIKIMNEFNYINRFFKPLTNKVGRSLQDDAAVFSSEKNVDYVVSTDTLVEKIHFFGTEEPEKIAKKALRVNLSDLAAMGAEPLYYSLSLALPKINYEYFMKSFTKGLKSDQKKFNIFLIGGDLSASKKHIVITISIIGKLPKGEAVSRNGAKTGDGLYVTGQLGLSNIGLNYYKSNKNEFKVAKNKYHIPEPRVEFAIKVRKYLNSMIDISDGLIQDAGHLAKNAGVHVILDFNALPLPEIGSLNYREILNSALYGGDDYELLFSLNPRYEKTVYKLAKKLNLQITKIGVIKKGKKGKVFNDLKEIKNKSYLHF